jgi:hypothetical protein
MERAFENVAIAIFFPRVTKEDFKLMVRALCLHMLIEHQVRAVNLVEAY